MNEATAKNFSHHLELMIEQANHALSIANNSGDEELKMLTQKILGGVVAELDLELLAPLHREFPALKPPNLP